MTYTNFHRSRFRKFSRRPMDGGNHGKRQAPREAIPEDKYIRKSQEAITDVSVCPEETVAFADLPIDQALKNNILGHGYKKTTPIQNQALPPALAGKDVVGIANTGTGKTAAFLIPIIQKTVCNRSERALIVVPTRELAVQVNDELKALAAHMGIYSSLLIGGASINMQVVEIRRDPHILIGTPGRLKDLINRGYLNMSDRHTIVLDEVDRMVDVGFLKDIQYLISKLPSDRQSLFFSATVTPDVESILRTFSADPVMVSVKTGETAQSIEQNVIRVKGREEKIEKLTEMLHQAEYRKVLVFGRTKWGVEKLTKLLRQKGFSAESIHGNKSLNQRFRALSEFRQNRIQVLVATDIAARGLDIEEVTHVINFDEPSTYTDYVHRIGRTGRAEKRGVALTFVC